MEELMQGRSSRGLLLAGIMGAAAIAAGPACAQNGADFYKGKTVTYIAATSPGGGYDLYGRLVAEFMQKHLPGSTFVVKNVPGAGHLVGANTIYASKPDGLTIGIFNTGLIYNQVLGAAGVKFDLGKMSWVGKAASDPRVITIGAQSPIKSLKDLQTSKETVNFAVGGVGSATYIESMMLTNVLKLPVKVLTGYSGGDDQMAVRRGEITGSVASRSSWEQFVKNGYGKFIAQIGGSQTDVPQLATMVDDPTAKAVTALIQSQGDIGRLTAGPPGIPQDRLDALRAAYKAAMEDKELLAKAEKLQIPIDPLYGDDVLNRVKLALNQTPQTVALLKEAMEKQEEPTAANKGTIAEWDGRAKLVLKLDDGKMFPAEVSGSRTEVTIGGQKSNRNNIKVGMACTVEGPSGGEAKAVKCN
jgi:tripartite-type tricarboxylate transporter receptor subunit TctC